jgi:hypothetical protein
MAVLTVSTFVLLKVKVYWNVIPSNYTSFFQTFRKMVVPSTSRLESLIFCTFKGKELDCLEQEDEKFTIFRKVEKHSFSDSATKSHNSRKLRGSFGNGTSRFLVNKTNRCSEFRFLLVTITLNILGSLSAHHQEPPSRKTAMVQFMQLGDRVLILVALGHRAA